MPVTLRILWNSLLPYMPVNQHAKQRKKRRESPTNVVSQRLRRAVKKIPQGASRFFGKVKAGLKTIGRGHHEILLTAVLPVCAAQIQSEYPVYFFHSLFVLMGGMTGWHNSFGLSSFEV